MGDKIMAEELTKEKALEVAKKLKAKEESLNNRELDLNKKEGNLNKRASELSAKEKLQTETFNQQKAEQQKELAAYGTKRKNEIEEECSNLRKERLASVENAIAKEYKELEEARKQKTQANEKITEELSKNLTDTKALLATEKSRADSAEADIKQYQIRVKTLEQKLEELTKKDAELQTSFAETNSLKEQNEKLNAQLSLKINEISQYKNLQAQIGENSLEKLIEEISNLHNGQEKLKQGWQNLSEDRKNYDFEKSVVQNRREQFSEERLNELVEEKLNSQYSKLIEENKKDIERLQEENGRLRNEIRINSKLSDSFEDFKAMFDGKNPAEIILENEKIKNELKEALDRIRETPSELLQKEYADLKSDKEHLLQESEELRRKQQECDSIKNNNAELLRENANLVSELDETKKHKNFIEEELKRLQSTYDNPATRDERIKAIEKPFILGNLARNPKTDINEVAWLSQIAKGIKDYGIQFPDRLLLAFHTALKSAEISPLTVLAGVSGTGKSLLPRLYSHFGGINFISVPVAPNWDCQEAMLGYYNSIDNYFDAQPVLRFLVQTQKNHKEDSNGFSDVMNLILLDEMNLANVELYFSEFLSKLEERRDYKDDDEKFPKLSVKIGSKMDDYLLPLGRNVLWTGTMNQDETTKTLSDKVLDRGIILNFPAPLSLESRQADKRLPEQAPLLKKENWQNWQKSDCGLAEDDFNSYKEIIEKINKELNKTGRALGHRVWQSIENYMRLHPEVIYSTPDLKKNALKKAFEDQLVQKVMPKLRGLETRGSQGDALDNIEKIIQDYSIAEDFDKAKNQGFGQFMWCSSDYIYKNPDSELLRNAHSDESNSSLTEDSNSENYAEMAAKYDGDPNAFAHFKKQLMDSGKKPEEAKSIAMKYFGKKSEN